MQAESDEVALAWRAASKKFHDTTCSHARGIEDDELMARAARVERLISDHIALVKEAMGIPPN